jgi:phosphoribosylamine--glycine ligase
MSIFRFGPVIVEEKVEGEESSYMAFCDGQHLARLPETRDHKRAFDQDQGPNTGGMGSYKNTDDWLPFMTRIDYQKEEQLIDRLFEHVRGKSRNKGLLGVPFYVAVMHTAKGPRILEINSRPGDPEILNILPIMKDDFVDICYSILDGSLIRVQTENKATVVTYKVPPTYGGREKEYTGDRLIDLQEANAAEHEGNLRLYPGSLELRDNEAYALSSRTVAAVGIGNSIDDARQRSLRGLSLIKGGNLWNRNDVASASSIQKSIQHMQTLRATN